MADTTPKSYSADPTLYLYTSLTAGSSHIITATSRLETILKANKIPFRALDVATDEKARMLWGRRSKGKKLPGLVRYGSIVGDLEEIEEWNEYGELKQQIGATAGAPPTPTTSTANTPSKPSALSSSAEPISTPRSAPMTKPEHISIAEPAEDMRKPSPTAPKKDDTPLTMAMRQAGAEAAAKAGQKKVVKPGSLLSDNPKSPDDPTSPTTAAPIANVKLGKASADPQASTETTAAKIPTKLAAEGAKRTSVDKITDSESSTDVETETPMQRSTEESKLEARRTSSITKQKSALSNETALESSSALGEQAEEPERPSLRTHRGSSVSDASKEEIAGIEKACAIPEEEESEDEQHTSHSAAQRLGFADVTSSSKQEEPATEDTKLPAEDAKAGEGAGVSVGD